MFIPHSLTLHLHHDRQSPLQGDVVGLIELVHVECRDHQKLAVLADGHNCYMVGQAEELLRGNRPLPPNPFELEPREFLVRSLVQAMIEA